MSINDLIPAKVLWAAIGINAAMFFVGMVLKSPELMVLNVFSAALCYVSIKVRDNIK